MSRVRLVLLCDCLGSTLDVGHRIAREGMQQIAIIVWYSSLVENMSVLKSTDCRFLYESSHSKLCSDSKLLSHYLLYR